MDKTARYILILCPPNLFIMYSGSVHTLLAMYTGKNTKPSSCSSTSAFR